jgi:hypothetical protein
MLFVEGCQENKKKKTVTAKECREKMYRLPTLGWYATRRSHMSKQLPATLAEYISQESSAYMFHQ